jgi:hypothetical protein
MDRVALQSCLVPTGAARPGPVGDIDGQRAPPPRRKSAMRVRQGVVGAVTGMAPGLILVLLALFVIKGEWQLTVGAQGIVLAVAGVVVGCVVGVVRSPRKPVDG